MAATVSSCGRIRVGPNTTPKFATVIRFCFEWFDTLTLMTKENNLSSVVIIMQHSILCNFAEHSSYLSVRLWHPDREQPAHRGSLPSPTSPPSGLPPLYRNQSPQPQAPPHAILIHVMPKAIEPADLGLESLAQTVSWAGRGFSPLSSLSDVWHRHGKLTNKPGDLAKVKERFVKLFPLTVLMLAHI